MWNHTGGTTSVGFLASPSFFLIETKKLSFYNIPRLDLFSRCTLRLRTCDPFTCACIYTYVHNVRTTPRAARHATPCHAPVPSEPAAWLAAPTDTPRPALGCEGGRGWAWWMVSRGGKRKGFGGRGHDTECGVFSWRGFCRDKRAKSALSLRFFFYPRTTLRQAPFSPG